MPWKPAYPGEIPTLGYAALEFMTENLLRPDRPMDPELFEPSQEQADFALALWRINPLTGRMVVRRAVLSRPRGWGKSPFVAGLGLAFAFAPVYFDGWDANGRPVGRPWSTVRTPIVQFTGVSEDQTDNTWIPLQQMVGEDAPIHDNYSLEVLKDVINLPGKGVVRPITTSAWTAKGGKPIAAFMDQTEVYFTGNGGKELARILRENATKIGGVVVETPNAYIEGDGSVAEATAKAAANRAQKLRTARTAGRATKLDDGFLYDHREAPGSVDLGDHESLIDGLRYVYGDSSDDPRGCLIHEPPCKPGWSPIDTIVQNFYDDDTDPTDARASFLNQIGHASNSYLSRAQWLACRRDDRLVLPGDAITMGFDGSRSRTKGKPDATALVGCRLSDGHLFPIGHWEAEDRPSTWKAWEAPVADIDAAVIGAFTRYRVVGFYCDPAKDWRSYVNTWEAKHSEALPDKAARVTATHPFEWWFTGGRSVPTERAVLGFRTAVVHREISHGGVPDCGDPLSRHIINARTKIRGGKLTIGKDSEWSELKVDAAVASVLALQARYDAIAAGARAELASPSFAMPSRIY